MVITGHVLQINLSHMDRGCNGGSKPINASIMAQPLQLIPLVGVFVKTHTVLALLGSGRVIQDARFLYRLPVARLVP
jgi:hypothetical protein